MGELSRYTKTFSRNTRTAAPTTPAALANSCCESEDAGGVAGVVQGHMTTTHELHRWAIPQVHDAQRWNLLLERTSGRDA